MSVGKHEKKDSWKSIFIVGIEILFSYVDMVRHSQKQNHVAADAIYLEKYSTNTALEGERDIFIVNTSTVN